MAANQYDLDYFRHVLKSIETWQLDGADLVAMLDLLRETIAERQKLNGLFVS